MAGPLTTNPGTMQFTVIPSGPRRVARSRVRPNTAILEQMYPVDTPENQPTLRAAREETLIIRPYLFFRI